MWPKTWWDLRSLTANTPDNGGAGGAGGAGSSGAGAGGDSGASGGGGGAADGSGGGDKSGGASGGTPGKEDKGDIFTDPAQPAGAAGNDKAKGAADGGGADGGGDKGKFPVVTPPKKDGAASDDKAGEKSGDDGKAKPTYFGAPEGDKDYEAPKLAEGMALDEKVFTEFKPIAKELGLNQAGVQRLSEFFSQYQQNAQTEWVETVQGWEKDAKKDAEIGGDKWDGQLANAQKAIEVFGTPALKELLNKYGMGNHPEVIRIFSRVGGAIGEEPTVDGGKQPGPTAPSTLDLFYGPKA